MLYCLHKVLVYILSSFHQVLPYIPEFISPSFSLHSRVHFTKFYFKFLSSFHQVLFYIPEFISSSFTLHSRVHFTKFYLTFLSSLQCNLDKNKKLQIDSSTIDGNVEFVHSQYSCVLSSQVSIQFLCPTKSSIIVILLE